MNMYAARSVYVRIPHLLKFYSCLVCFGVFTCLCRIGNYRSWGSWITAISSDYVTSSTPVARRYNFFLFSFIFAVNLFVVGYTFAKSIYSHILLSHKTIVSGDYSKRGKWSMHIKDKITQMQRKENYPNLKKGKQSISWTDKYRNNSEFNVAEVNYWKQDSVCV